MTKWFKDAQLRGVVKWENPLPESGFPILVAAIMFLLGWGSINLTFGVVVGIISYALCYGGVLTNDSDM